jgi:hypothetical protein
VKYVIALMFIMFSISLSFAQEFDEEETFIEQEISSEEYEENDQEEIISSEEEYEL